MHGYPIDSLELHVDSDHNGYLLVNIGLKNNPETFTALMPVVLIVQFICIFNLKPCVAGGRRKFRHVTDS
jgi:hypothetical protein